MMNYLTSFHSLQLTNFFVNRLLDIRQNNTELKYVKSFSIYLSISVYFLQTVTFQCLLITDGQSTFTVFNYIDVDLKPIQNKNITIGFQYKDSFEKNSFSQKNVAFKMSNVPGNRGIYMYIFFYHVHVPEFLFNPIHFTLCCTT